MEVKMIDIKKENGFTFLLRDGDKKIDYTEMRQMRFKTS